MSEAGRRHQAALQAYQAGKAVDAITLLKQAIVLDPDVASFHADLAVILKGIASADERLIHYRRAIDLEPANPVYHANLAAALNAVQQFCDAEAAAQRALDLAPERAESWHNLGSALSGQQRWLEAETAYERALALGLNALPTRLAAGRSALRAGSFETAIGHSQAALSMTGLDMEQELECWQCIAKANVALDRGESAVQAFLAALELVGGNTALLIDLGNLYKQMRQIDAARKCYVEVRSHHPDCIEAKFNLAALDQDVGRYQDAIEGYRAVLNQDPNLPIGWHNLASCLTYSAQTCPGEGRATLAAFDARIAAPLRQPRLFTNARDRMRRLKVGYVSADFRAHPVGYLALPLIEGHDRAQVHVSCYFSHHRRDDWTDKFQAAADAWVDVATLEDAALAERIAADGIDILVDLAGHSEGNRLLAFARKPAPVQVTWPGYVTTTGMNAMDWRLTYEDADPAGVEAEYTERLWRLPGALWCFRPLPGMPEVSPLPCLRNGFVRFAVFNRFSKNSPEALSAWAEILCRTPNSRLLVCAAPGEASERLRRVFAEHGIDLARVEVFAHGDHARFWALHGQVDIALDPFPFNGGMTTYESLWLGVPVVSCSGVDGELAENSFPARYASRMGTAILKKIGLNKLASNTITGYVDIAVELAQETARLAELRQSLRARMATSPLMNEARFVIDVEMAYRAMWQDWLKLTDQAD